MTGATGQPEEWAIETSWAPCAQRLPSAANHLHSEDLSGWSHGARTETRQCWGLPSDSLVVADAVDWTVTHHLQKKPTAVGLRVRRREGNIAKWESPPCNTVR
ncbi:hypothetical protein NDU88_008977 [Pleurodeles waltl]|uniref:Uncharacterized protein n=1 Tax=Pleurodeles waltl TaxID=8319 RepID=A0AAV7QQE9_PLEWA|nr:hypothetical protein NDU88_008977 [Pleurodeles waltl]